jgi:hypothetical protein
VQNADGPVLLRKPNATDPTEGDLPTFVTLGGPFVAAERPKRYRNLALPTAMQENKGSSLALALALCVH